MIREYLITAVILLFGLGMYQLVRIDERDDAARSIKLAATSMDAANKALVRCADTLEGVSAWMR